MNTYREIEREGVAAFLAVLTAFPGLRAVARPIREAREAGFDGLIEVTGRKFRLRVAIESKMRLTPQVALSVRYKLTESVAHLSAVYSPVISPRVAAILREGGIGYLDRAGNCFLRSEHPPFLIERRGFKGERIPTPAAADPFSPKSSRMIRQMLTQPMKGWKVRELSAHPNVKVSLGLVVKVKRALIEEGFAAELDGWLFLRDASGLLNAWAAKFSGPVEEIPVYIRGEAANAEWIMGATCAGSELEYAYSGFSAAWRLAPEVRYNVGTVYVEDAAFHRDRLDFLIRSSGGKRVDSGHNLLICRPYDCSVFTGKSNEVEPVTSPVQTYLDLKRLSGRGEEAARAVYLERLSQEFEYVAKREAEGRHARG